MPRCVLSFVFTLSMLCIYAQKTTAPAVSPPTKDSERYTYLVLQVNTDEDGNIVENSYEDLRRSVKESITDDLPETVVQAKFKEIEEITSNKTPQDLLNYYGNKGWELVQVNTMQNSRSPRTLFYLKKKMSRP